MVRTQIDIHAPASEVRKVCLDFAKIPEWHRGLIESVERLDSSLTPLKAGDQLRYRSGGVTGTPTIVVNSESELRWKGSLGGVLYGNHFFGFEPSEKGPEWTRFVHGEDVTGAVGFFFWDWSPLVLWWIRGQFDAFNRDLKARVEGTGTKLGTN